MFTFFLDLQNSRGSLVRSHGLCDVLHAVILDKAIGDHTFECPSEVLLDSDRCMLAIPGKEDPLCHQPALCHDLFSQELAGESSI